MAAHKGIALSLVSSVLFAVLCYYSVFLHPLNGWQIAGWRAVTTVLSLMLALAFRKKRGPFWHYLMSVIKSTRLLIATFACAARLGLQILIFCWAPVNGQSRSLALGYFLLPLVMVVTGRALYGETMSGWQKIAVLPAIALLIYQGSGKEWLPVGPAGGEVTLAGLGLLSGSALLCFLLASSSLSFTVFGMLSYAEPLLLFLVSLFLPGEKLTRAYGCQRKLSY